jgi:hypothetical protein
MSIKGQGKIWRAMIKACDDHRIKLVRDTPNGKIDVISKSVIIEAILWKAIEQGAIKREIEVEYEYET